MWPAAKSFIEHINAHGSRIALSSGEQTVTYLKLLELVSERSERLRTLGAKRVALALDNGLDWILWDLAVLNAGLVCIPLPSFFSAAQQEHVLTSASVDCYIGKDADPIQALGFKPCAPDIALRQIGESCALHPGTCKITYTSGTTGNPKGVCLDIAAQLAVADSLYQASLPCNIEIHLCVLPLATLLENLAGVYAPLLAGARIELLPMAQIGLLGASQFELPRFLNAINTIRPNSLILLPQLLLALVTAAERGMPVPDSLRFIAVGGGRVSPQLLQRAEQLGLAVFEGYGLSECASVVCLNTPLAHKSGTTGIPLGHAEVRIGADHEVQVKGPHMLGYLGEPAIADEWLGTGDLGHFDGDFLVLHGRKKNQFITAFGRNVNPEWVESELVQQLPIAQAWLYGEALPANIAVIVPRSPSIPDAELAEAINAVNLQLPDYAQVHHWIRSAEPFSASNQLATANGRLRRSALLSRYQSTINELITSEHRVGASYEFL